MSGLTNLEKIRRLPWQLTGNAFNVVFWFTAAAGSVFILFLDELGLDKARIGFLLSLLPFFGLTAIFTAPYIARFGVKRIFLIFFGARTIFAVGLLFSPFITNHFGLETAFLWVSCCVSGFALCRAISETAIYPWVQEMIPDNIRGKFSGINSIIVQIVSIATVAIAGIVIGHYEGLNKFIFIIAVGILAGILAVWCFFFVPGGKPVPYAVSTGGHFRGMFQSLKDKNFRCYMFGLSLVTLGINSLIGFIPLYMKEQVGLSSEFVVWLDIGTYAGALLSSLMWGWTADRFGSKPVMLSGPFVMLTLPILCFIIPRHTDLSTEIAMLITFLLGIATTAWNIGLARYLYVNAVPTAQKTPYMAVFYAGAGLTGGIAPLLAGYLLKNAAAINTHFMVFQIDAYSPLFLLSTFFLVAGIIELSKVRSDGAVTMRRFVGMFLQGNPLLAVGSLIRYYRVPDEEARVSITKHLGYANNPISNYELIEALNDPSFNVRYEAIIAVAHSRPDPELVDALILVLGGNEPDLSVNAAWALGRMGDKSAILPLRETLCSEYSLLCARSARALATLGDTASIPFFLEYFRTEPDPGLRIAYAQSLGKLRYAEVIDEMLVFLSSLEDPTLRSEMALALGRIIGDERQYIALWRQLKEDMDTGTAMTILSLKTNLSQFASDGTELKKKADRASSAFAYSHHKRESQLLAEFLQAILEHIDSKQPVAVILAECIRQLNESGISKMEYILLALHAARTALSSSHENTHPVRKSFFSFRQNHKESTQ